MLYMGAMMLLVLPLFLIICVRVIRKSDLAHKPIGVFLEAIFIVSIAFSCIGLLFLIAQIIKKF